MSSSSVNVSTDVFNHCQFKEISHLHKGSVIRITNTNGTTLTGILKAPFLPYLPVYHIQRLTMNDRGGVAEGNFHMAPSVSINTIRVLAKSLELWLAADIDAPRQIAEELKVYPEDGTLYHHITSGKYDLKEGVVKAQQSQDIVATVPQRPVVKTAVKTSRCCPT